MPIPSSDVPNLVANDFFSGISGLRRNTEVRWITSRVPIAGPFRPARRKPGGSLPGACRRAAPLIRAQTAGSSPGANGLTGGAAGALARVCGISGARARSRNRDVAETGRIRCHPATALVHPTDMKKICSWCQGQMVIPLRRSQEAEVEELPNYGMCGSCLEAELEALSPAPRPPPPPARAPPPPAPWAAACPKGASPRVSCGTGFAAMRGDARSRAHGGRRPRRLSGGGPEADRRARRPARRPVAVSDRDRRLRGRHQRLPRRRAERPVRRGDPRDREALVARSVSSRGPHRSAGSLARGAAGLARDLAARRPPRAHRHARALRRVAAARRSSRAVLPARAASATRSGAAISTPSRSPPRAITRAGRSRSCRASPGHPVWSKSRRVVLPVTLTVDHVLASSAIPIVFPPVQVACRSGELWFGDGGLRLVTPFSPAIRLGATRLLGVGVRSSSAADVARRGGARDGRARRARRLAVAAAGAGLRRLHERDLPRPPRRRPRPPAAHERARRRARRRSRARGARRRRPSRCASSSRSWSSPSEDLALVAQRFAHRMPRLVRYVLDGLGTPDAQSADLMSYLLFDGAYTARARRDRLPRRGRAASTRSRPSSRAPAPCTPRSARTRRAGAAPGGAGLTVLATVTNYTRPRSRPRVKLVGGLGPTPLVAVLVAQAALVDLAVVLAREVRRRSRRGAGT